MTPAGGRGRVEAVCVVGPTASGKSALADALARRLRTSVISVDAMQVYRGMDVGTAKVPVRERSVPLEMVDVCEVFEPYSVERFQAAARRCVDRELSLGRVAVLCGGTGLYLDAVIDEMEFPSGELGGESRARWEAEADRLGPEGLHALLERLDPESARLIHPNNVRRCVRALEMLDEGTSYARQHEGLLRRRPHYRAALYAPLVPRELLYARIDRRVGRMYEEGLLDEVRGLRERGLESSPTASQAIGYREALDVLDGRLDREEAIERTRARTRRYAKRQLNWLRRDGRVRWLDVRTLGVEAAVETIVSEQGLDDRDDATGEGA